MIGVKNKGDKDITGRYNGEDYVFRAGQVTAVSEDAARHIFCFGQEDKLPALRRFGWLRDSGQYEEAKKRLDVFVFLAVEEVKFKEVSGLPAASDKQSLAHPEGGASKIDVPEFGKQAKK